MKFLSLFAAVIMGLCAYAQNDYPYGQFKIRNIDRSEYFGGLQNWDIIQNEDHFLYLANNAGILEFNGEQWRKFEMVNREHPRSFAKNESGDIFVGGQDEFGIIRYDDKGAPFIEKLSEQVDSIDFNAIWNIACIEEKTYFLSRYFVFILDGDEIETISVEELGQIKYSHLSENKILITIHSEEGYLSYIISGSKLLPIQNSENIEIIGLIRRGAMHTAIDEQGNLYKLMSNGNNFMLEAIEEKLQRVSESKLLSVIANDRIIVASVISEGIEIFDLEGNFIRSVGESDGLGNGLINKSLFDQYSNLWLCSDNGISFVEMSSSITAFDKRAGVNAGATEDLDFIGDKVILATHSDMYSSEIVNGRMQFMNTPLVSSDLWQIRNFTMSDGQNVRLIISNNYILRLYDDGHFERIQPDVFAWHLEQSTSDPNRIFVGMDGDGIGSFYYSDGNFDFEGYYPNTSGDVRSVAEYNGDIYYTVKYDGLVKLDSNKTQEENIISGLQKDGEGADFEQFSMEIFNGILYLGTTNGLYEYDGTELKPSEANGGDFFEDKLLIHRIINDGDGKLWMVMFHDSETQNEELEMGYLQEQEGELIWHSSQFNQLKDDVVYSIKKSEEGIYWFGGVQGVYVYNESAITQYESPFNVFISGVYLNEEEELVYHAEYASKSEFTISYDQNSIKFQFAANAYLGGIENEYAYYLEGEEEGWSKWKSTPHAEFQRLGEGNYTFHLKARNFYGYESEKTTFSFTITPPWYRTWWAYFIYVILVIGIIYLIIRLSIRRVKAQNERLELIVEERTAEIAQQNTVLEHQKAEIEEKTNDILDSIKYAERIQTAILPTDETLSQIFDGEHFVLYKPKDIVSGDFYWSDRFDNEAIFAAVDCTGHGVPGAFVSIVGFNGLNRTVNEFKLRKPGEILDKLTDLVVDTFAKSESQIKDGMDIALCNINYKTGILTYAGANNPLILIRNGELTEIKANKQPIGEFQNRVPFTTHEIKLEKGDCIYVFSDGYADQFGGEKGKKFKGKALKQLLLDISTFDMKTQHQKLHLSFENWKGDFEQLDDVCLFGVKY